jgi:hypothetical protein
MITAIRLISHELHNKNIALLQNLDKERNISSKRKEIAKELIKTSRWE